MDYIFFALKTQAILGEVLTKEGDVIIIMGSQ